MNNEPPKRPAPPRRGVFDVMPPGRTPASPTSRPVIAQSQIKDPGTAMSGVGESSAHMQARQNAAAAAAPVAPVVAASPPPPAAQPPAPAPRPAAPAPAQPAGTVIAPQTPVDPATFFAPDPEPPVAAKRARSHVLSELFAIFAIIVLLAVIFNILLDAEIINLPVPHTNFFDY